MARQEGTIATRRVTNAMRKRASPVYQKARAEIPLKGAGEYPFPPRVSAAKPEARRPPAPRAASASPGPQMPAPALPAQALPAPALPGISGLPGLPGVPPVPSVEAPVGVPGAPVDVIPEAPGAAEVTPEMERDFLLALLLVLLGGGARA